LVPWCRGAVVALVITGGTGSYAGAFGEGTLTPTPTGSTVARGVITVDSVERQADARG